MNTAGSVRLAKSRNPSAYCADRKCLWRIRDREGNATPCPRHPAPPAASEADVWVGIVRLISEPPPSRDLMSANHCASCGIRLISNGVTVREHWIAGVAGLICDDCVRAAEPITRCESMFGDARCTYDAGHAEAHFHGGLWWRDDAPRPDTRPSITERIARFRVTRIESHVVEGMRSLGEVWEAIDLLAGPDEKCEHIVGVRNDEAFCFRHPDFECDAPIAVQHARMDEVLGEPAS